MQKKDVVALILQHLTDIIPDIDLSVVTDEDDLADLGANSMDRSEIIIMTMESLELDIPRTELVGANSIGELAEVFCSKLG